MHLAVSLMLLLSDGALAAQVHMTRAELCEVADRVVIGEVTDIETRPSADDSIERMVHLSIRQTVKGDASDDLVVTVPGGTLGEVSLWVEHSPVFLSDATYMLFIAPDGSVVAGEQGTVRITGPNALKGESLEQALESVEVCREN